MEDDDISRLADHFGVNEEEISRMQTRVSGRDLSPLGKSRRRGLGHLRGYAL